MNLFTISKLSLLVLVSFQNAVAAVDGDDAVVQEAPAPPEFTEEENALFELTNAERKRNNLPLFILDPKLMRMAREHSESMARLQQLSHTIAGRSFSVRLQESGYQSMAAGENIAEGQSGASEAVQDWMNSPGHRGNIMNGQYTDIGVAVAVSASGRRFYTQVFARPFPSSNPSAADPESQCPSCRNGRTRLQQNFSYRACSHGACPFSAFSRTDGFDLALVESNSMQTHV